LAAFDKIDDGPINVVLDSLAGPISQSAEGNHHFLVEPACGKTRKPQLFNVIRPLSGGCVHAALLPSFRATRKQILLSSPGRNRGETQKNLVRQLLNGPLPCRYRPVTLQDSTI
jgi:hypothetical protein